MRVLVFLLLLLLLLLLLVAVVVTVLPLGLKPPPPLDEDDVPPVLADSKNPISRQVLLEGTNFLTCRLSSADAGRLRKRFTAVTFSGRGLSLRIESRFFSTGGVE